MMLSWFSNRARISRLFGGISGLVVEMCLPAELLSSDRRPQSLTRRLRTWQLVLLLRSVHLLTYLAHWVLLLSTWSTVVGWLFCALVRLRAITKAAPVHSTEGCHHL
jgi:hypothetical protein